MGTPDISRSAPEAARRILSWYRQTGRSLPWRRTRRPYRVLLSEVMLQQTQVSRVEQKYPEFLRKFPTLRALAHAPQRDVIMAWRGLGYNNRAVRLHALAKHLHGDKGGRFPRDVEALNRLPGIGRYTAHAIAAFAFGQQHPVVDVNVRRVLSRFFFRMKTTAALVDESTAWRIAGEVLPAGKAYDWNQALMDLGATVCTAARPRCMGCPVATVCASRPSMKPVPRRFASAGAHEAGQTPPARRQATPPREPSHRGIPLRMYRGRVIEALRDAHPRRSVSALRLGKAILPHFTERDRRVFHRVLRALERDGLVEVRRGQRAMPERISLA